MRFGIRKLSRRNKVDTLVKIGYYLLKRELYSSSLLQVKIDSELAFFHPEGPHDRCWK